MRIQSVSCLISSYRLSPQGVVHLSWWMGNDISKILDTVNVCIATWFQIQITHVYRQTCSAKVSIWPVWLVNERLLPTCQSGELFHVDSTFWLLCTNRCVHKLLTNNFNKIDKISVFKLKARRHLNCTTLDVQQHWNSKSSHKVWCSSSDLRCVRRKKYSNFATLISTVSFYVPSSKWQVNASRRQVQRAPKFQHLQHILKLTHSPNFKNFSTNSQNLCADSLVGNILWAQIILLNSSVCTPTAQVSYNN